MTQGPYGSQQSDPWSPGGQNWHTPESQQPPGASPDPSWRGPGSAAADQPQTSQPDWGNPNWSEPGPAGQPSSAGPLQNPYLDAYAPAPYAPAASSSWAGSAYADPAEQHSSKGVVAIWLVGAAIVISFILSWIGGQAIVELYHLTGITISSSGDYPDTSATDGPYTKLGLTVIFQVIPSGLGIAGLIVGALGIRHSNSRALGIVSLILAIVAPFLSVGVMLIAAGPAI